MIRAFTLVRRAFGWFRRQRLRNKVLIVFGALVALGAVLPKQKVEPTQAKTRAEAPAATSPATAKPTKAPTTTKEPKFGADVPWNNYSPEVKDRIKAAVATKDCTTIQAEYDPAVANNRNQRDRTLRSESNSALISLLAESLADSKCKTPPTVEPVLTGVGYDVRRFGAFEVCTKFVKDRLKSPATAKFRNEIERDGEVTWSTDDDVTWLVKSSVDSENGFGALIRNQFGCEVQFVGDDQWQLVDISMSEN
jgi:hypothetical protein